MKYQGKSAIGNFLRHMKTIAVDCRMLWASGVGTYLRAVLCRLIEKKYYHFVLLGNRETISRWLEHVRPGVSIVHCDAPLYGIREQWKLWRAIPKKCDLFWAPHYVTPLLYNGNMLVTIHDMAHLAIRESVPNRAALVYAKLMFSYTVNKASKVITVSQFTKNELIKYINIIADKIEVIPHGCPELPRLPSSNIMDKSYILYIGNVKPSKNLRRVIEAHARIFPVIQQPLIIVGKREGFITSDVELNKMVKDLPEHQVRFTGYISDQELARYYGEAGMLVFASLYEGFGFPAIEAMSFGVPVLASRAASLPEVCQDAALYCDPYSIEDIAEKMEKLMENSALRNTLIEKGQERIRFFSWDKSVSRHLSVIDEVLRNADS